MEMSRKPQTSAIDAYNDELDRRVDTIPTDYDTAKNMLRGSDLEAAALEEDPTLLDEVDLSASVVANGLKKQRKERRGLNPVDGATLANAVDEACSRAEATKGEPLTESEVNLIRVNTEGELRKQRGF